MVTDKRHDSVASHPFWCILLYSLVTAPTALTVCFTFVNMGRDGLGIPWWNRLVYAKVRIPRRKDDDLTSTIRTMLPSVHPNQKHRIPTHQTSVLPQSDQFKFTDRTPKHNVTNNVNCALDEDVSSSCEQAALTATYVVQPCTTVQQLDAEKYAKHHHSIPYMANGIVHLQLGSVAWFMATPKRLSPWNIHLPHLCCVHRLHSRAPPKLATRAFFVLHSRKMCTVLLVDTP